MLVSNRVSSTRPEWLYSNHPQNHVHKVAHMNPTSTHSYKIKLRFQHKHAESSTPELSEALKGSRELYGVKVRNLSTCMERLKAELEITHSVQATTATVVIDVLFLLLMSCDSNTSLLFILCDPKVKDLALRNGSP